jgi:hypothetical protein
MLALLFAFGRADCGNVRDKIFGLTGIARACCVRAIGTVDYDINIIQLVRRVWEHSFTHDDKDLGNWLYLEDDRSPPDQRELMLMNFNNGSVEYATFKNSLPALGESLDKNRGESKGLENSVSV